MPRGEIAKMWDRPFGAPRGGNFDRVYKRVHTGEIVISYDTIPLASPRLERGTVECLCQLPDCDHEPDHCTRLASRVYWYRLRGWQFAYMFVCDACDTAAVSDARRRALLGRLAPPMWRRVVTGALVLAGLVAGAFLVLRLLAGVP
jgi:hypothetical protein